MPTNFTWSGGAGPQSWATPGNWTPSGPPANGDSAFVLSGNSDISTGLAQSAVTLANLIVGPDFAGTIGTATAQLAIGATTWTIDASAAGRVNLDFGTAAFVGVQLDGQASGADASLGLETVRIKGVNAGNKVFLLGGTLGIATNAIGDVATIPEIDVLNANAVLNCASGVTLTLIQQEDGTVTVNSALPSLQQDGGTLTTQGTGALGGTLLNVGGTVISNSTGNVSNAVIRSTGTLDFNQYPAARTSATAINVYSGGTLKGNKLWMTYTGGIITPGCRLDDVNIDCGYGRTYSVT